MFAESELVDPVTVAINRGLTVGGVSDNDIGQSVNGEPVNA